MLWYGTVLTYGILKSIVIKRKLMSARFYRKSSKSYVRGSYGVVAQARTITDTRNPHRHAGETSTFTRSAC